MARTNTKSQHAQTKDNKQGLSGSIDSCIKDLGRLV